MIADIPAISPADAAELTRLLMLVFKGDEPRAAKWMKERCDPFHRTPLDLLKRDEIGVVRLLSFLRDAVP